MDGSIGKRIKTRNKQRLEEVKKRNKMEEEEDIVMSSPKKRKWRRRTDTDSDIEDITPALNDNLPAAEVSHKNNFSGSQQNKCVEDNFFETRDFDVEKSVPSSSGFGKWYKQKKNLSEIRGLDVEKSVADEIVIISDSESEIEKKASTKKKLFEDGSQESTSDDDDGTSEEDNHDTEDDIMVDIVSSEDPSSSSSDEEFNLKEVVGDTDDDDDDLRKVNSPVRKVSKAGRYKRSGSCLTKPRKQDKKIQKLNRPEEEEEEVERVTKEQSNTVVFTCIHCGKDNTGIPAATTRAQDSDMNNFASTNVSKHEDSVFLNSRKTPEKPSTSTPESVYSEKEKAVAEGLNKPALSNEPIDDESSSSISSGYESEPSQKEKECKSNNNAEWRMMNGNHKEVDLFRRLVNSVWEKDQSGEGGEDKLVSSLPQEQDERKYDNDGFLVVRPPPLILRFGVEEPQPPPVISEWEREEAKLWDELALYSNSNELLSDIEKELSTDESPAGGCKKGNHELRLDLEIGMKCIQCGFLEREIRSMDVSEWVKKTSGRRKIDRSEEEEEEEEGGSRSFIGLEALNKKSSNEECVSSEGTVWDKIPGIKSQMYLHQQEGFEFMWRNLAGTIMLNELNKFENSDETGGCIMSHAPGTGKTRLTIIFLQAYLECFPNCKPVIIAPASLLLTWEEEFKKWNIGIPFHNVNNLEFNGKESSMALNLLMHKNSSARSNNEIRMVKIYSWIKAKSILGISYNLYEKLAGVKDDDKKTKTMREVKADKELEDIREILMGKPGLLVLDEAHTPRNKRSCIWKTLSKVETQKRILLSGTPFQNNFEELCNVLGLARPKYLEKLTSTVKKSSMNVRKRGRRALGEEIDNRGIEDLKTVMLPFVHVHEGSILQESLPGLRDCVVVLNPPELQKRVLESIEVTHNRKKKNVFETEHKLSLVSVHPSLVSHCTLSEKECLSIDSALLAQLEKTRLDPNQSVKTRFLMEFIGLCQKIKEKVLVFSQYIHPLELIMEHLVSRFNWNPGEEVLYMHGKLEQKQRQILINEFNDPNSKAKVLLASTRACSEGINLVGASRVILLDVVWNPAVERQAISRAYRIGQQRIVYTYHLVAKGTPEGVKYCKQAHKDRISEMVFASSSRHDKGKDKIAEAMTEDKVLDIMVQHQKLGDMFDNLIIQPKEADLVEGFSILMP